MDGRELENEIAKLLLAGKNCVFYNELIFSRSRKKCGHKEREHFDKLPKIDVCELWM